MVETPVQMRFADVDQLGHVNNVNLQHYFDLGKTTYYAQVLDFSIDWKKIGLIQRLTTISFEAQTRLMEPVVVLTKVEQLGTTSVGMYQEIRNTETGELKAFSRSVLVMFDFEEQRKMEIPAKWRTTIEEFEGHKWPNKESCDS